MRLPDPLYTVTDKNHRYTITTKTGEKIGPLDSVTKVLGVLNKPALVGWAAREASDFFKTEILRLGKGALNVDTLESIAASASLAHRRKATDAANLGTAAHKIFQDILENKAPDTIPPELSGPLRAFKDWRLNSDIEIVGLEIGVGSVRHKFGGRLDAIGYSKQLGGFGIVDFKTSSGFYGNEYAYQVGGYALAVEEQYGVKVAWAEIARFSKKAPYNAEVRPVLDMGKAKSSFLEALNVLVSEKVRLIGDPSFFYEGEPSPAKKEQSPLSMGF